MDIGGTKTRVIAARKGVTLADETVATETWRTWRVGDDAEGLATLVKRVCGGAVPQSFAVGAHGCDSDQQCEELREALAARLPGAQVKVVNDSELLVPAAGYVSGIGVVSGTGSIAVARSREGHMLAAGGWGWILGDEGSAAALVREAAKAVRGAVDNERLDDPLVALLPAAVGTKEVTKLGRVLNEVRGAAEWGRFANVVFDAAAEGSPLAHKVIADGARALAELIGVLARRGADASVVVAGGGVITEQPLLWDAFRSAVAIVSPTSEAVLLRQAPVVGAVALAERALNTPRIQQAV
jgi:N-acetylglucosamine kinase-like BadF-type ATPase